MIKSRNFDILNLTILKMKHLIDKWEQQQQKIAQASPAKAACLALRALSERELNVAVLTAEGLSAWVIADRLNISPRTVEKHKASTFTKLNIHTIAELTRLIVLANVE